MAIEGLGPGDLGACLAVNRLLAWSDRATLVLRGFVVYTAVFEARLGLRWADTHGLRRAGYPWLRRQAYEADTLKLGFQLPDGTRYTNLDRLELRVEHTPGWDELWASVAALPGPGTLVVACEWPAAGLEHAELEVAAEPIRALAGTGEILLPL